MPINRPSLQSAPWKAEHISQLVTTGKYENVPWWPDFERAYYSYPEDHFAHLSQKLFDFTNRFSGAVWELFLWQKFTDLGAEVELEVPIPGGNKSCDFSVTFPGCETVFVEATHRSVKSELVAVRRIEKEFPAQLADSLHCREHFITASVVKHSGTRPDFHRLCNDVNEWIWRHETIGGDSDASLRVIDTSGWTLDFQARKLESGATGFASFTHSFKDIDESSLIRSAVETKMKKFQAKMTNPLVIAVAVDSEWWKSDLFERFAALYARPAIRVDKITGESSGDFADYWTLLSNNAYSSNVSGVLFSDGEYPGFSSNRKLDLWLNETASLQVDVVSFPAAQTYRRVEADGILTWDCEHHSAWKKTPFP